ncbi:MAG: pentapeptide repeat-containing protein [Anaerovoracaceae bacterium]
MTVDWPVGINLSGVDLSGVDLSGADLSGANLSRVNLSRADLYDANLARADLRGASLAYASLRRANLSEAYLFRADLFRADLFEANLTGALLAGSDLRGVDLTGAALRGADLRGVDLTGAHLEKADLTHVNLYGATLIRANLEGTITDGAYSEKAADEPVSALSPLLTASADVTHEQDKSDRVDKTNPAVLRWVREQREFDSADGDDLTARILGLDLVSLALDISYHVTGGCVVGGRMANSDDFMYRLNQLVDQLNSMSASLLVEIEKGKG